MLQKTYVYTTSFYTLIDFLTLITSLPTASMVNCLLLYERK